MSDSLRPHELQHAKRKLVMSITNSQLAQTHAHWIGDAIQTSHTLLSPSPSVFSLSQHQGLFQGVSSLHQMSRVLEFQLQHQCFQMNIQDWFPLGLTGWISLQSKGLQESSPTPQFKSISSLVLSFLYSSALTSIHDYWENHSFDWMAKLAKYCLCFLICCLGWW